MRRRYGRLVDRGSMALFENRQLRKRWRYVGVFAGELMLCAARAEAWTRKRVGMPVEGIVEVPGRRWEVAGRGVDDEFAGHHQRHTSWRWSAGIGDSSDGR